MYNNNVRLSSKFYIIFSFGWMHVNSLLIQIYFVKLNNNKKFFIYLRQKYFLLFFDADRVLTKNENSREVYIYLYKSIHVVLHEL